MKQIAYFLLPLLVIACSSSLEFDKKIFEDLYSLDVESSMVPTGDMDPNAEIEYGNEFKEFYFKVIHQSIKDYQSETMTLHLEEDELMEHYLMSVKEDYLNYMSAPTWIGEEARIINSMPCVIHELSTDGNGFPIRYKVAYFMSKTRIYELHIWTMETRLERFSEGIDQMINSFKEI